jgi:hypothetical protein
MRVLRTIPLAPSNGSVGECKGGYLCTGAVLFAKIIDT